MGRNWICHSSSFSLYSSPQLFGPTWVEGAWKFLVSSGGPSDMSVLVSSTAHLTQPSGSSTDIFLALCSKQRSCYSCPACPSPVSWFWLNGSLITVLLKWKAKRLTWTPPFPLITTTLFTGVFRAGPPKWTLPFCSAHFSCSPWVLHPPSFPEPSHSCLSTMLPV